ncbi:DUF6480 family protein [Streptomyces sp. NEAU-Y11]|uniref:DUF6480 family protein n=1 Tax=Streptomyces cucumeris TaxID=2962890 RepID=UPI0027E4DB93|nr:DUF6480 family protein [Streptomyces sp. NEAU-Y11]
MSDRTPEPDPRRTARPEPERQGPATPASPSGGTAAAPAADIHRTPGTDQAHGVPPGETPPAEGSTAGAGPQETYNPTKGWSTAPILVILVLVAFFVAFCVAYAVTV